MFETIVHPGRRRSAKAAAAAVAVHAAAIALAVLLSSAAGVGPTPPPIVRVLPPKFTVPQTGGRNGAAQPPRPPDRRPDRPKPPRVNIAPEVQPPPAPPEETPLQPVESEPASDPAVQAGPGGAVTGGEGPDGEGIGLAGPGKVVDYQPQAMTPPRRISGPDPEYTPEAIQSEVQGVMIVKCVVTVEGAVHGCRVLQGLPTMDRAVVEALERRRYSPARLQNGQPVEVDYTFRIRLQLPY